MSNRYVKTCLVLHFPSKVSVCEEDWKSECYSRFPDLLTPFSFSEGRGCNFRLLVKESQIFGEADKSLLIDSLASMLPVLEVLALKLRHEAVWVNGLCQMIRWQHACWNSVAGEWAGRKRECGISRHSSRKKTLQFLLTFECSQELEHI